MKNDRAYCSRILVIDDDKSIREGCSRILAGAGYQVDAAMDAKGGIGYVDKNSYDVILLDLRMPDMGGIEAISKIREKDSEAVIVIITGFPTIASAVEAVKEGAFDYISKPFTPEQLLFHVERAVEKRLEDARADNLRRRLRWKEEEIRIVAGSRAMKEVLKLVEKVAPSDSTVLITGESGTGKEVIARHIHRLSARNESEFVAVDCSALVESLIESELFGHVKGAFTGAWRSARGSLELADGGTFFFDEVSNLSLSVQAKILRTIQEREVRRIGDPRPISVDVRILAATNRDLKKEVEKEVFRKDLYYRLNVFPIQMPLLRERREDILPLATEFLEIFCARKRQNISGFTGKVRGFMLSYGWPGNVRELRNLVERAVSVEEGREVSLSSMLIEPDAVPGDRDAGQEAEADKEPMTLKEAEALHVQQILRETGWNKGRAARLLGIDKKTLNSKIKRYKLEM